MKQHLTPDSWLLWKDKSLGSCAAASTSGAYDYIDISRKYMCVAVAMYYSPPSLPFAEWVCIFASCKLY